MKRLSLKNNTTTKYFRLKEEPIRYIFKDDFSGFQLKETTLRGACLHCKEQFCAKYSDKELELSVIKGFPKSRTDRVCPNKAIHIDSNGQAFIDNKVCIKCGLCIYRCPFAAIQYSTTNGASVNTHLDSSFVQVSIEQQNQQIQQFRSLEIYLTYKPISVSFSSWFQKKLSSVAKKCSDLSEIIIRNTFLNSGWICNTNTQGNNYIRIEYIAEYNKKSILLGESEINLVNPDVLTVNRRILDDLAVAISRYDLPEDVIPLAVINTLPNKRTDFYEVISDIEKVTRFSIKTMTYHILFVLNLYRVKLTPKMIQNFVVNSAHQNLWQSMLEVLPNLSKIDNSKDTNNYGSVEI